MRHVCACLLLCVACASAPRHAALDAVGGAACAPSGGDARADAQLELPPVPPLAAPDPALAPAGGRLERDAAVADRFTSAQQFVEYEFDAQRGELSLFSLETWGYAFGWHSRARIAVLDEQGRSFDAHPCEGGMASFDFLAFVAPHDGRFRYRIELEQGWFRYRLARRSTYRAHLRGAVEEIGSASRVAGYLASGEDELAYRLAVAAHQRIDLKLLHAEVQGRSEQRGRGANVLHPSFDLALDPAPAHEVPGAYVVLAPGEERSVVVHVRTRAPGGGGRFELLVQRDPLVCAVSGVVVDREDRPLAGVDLEFLRGVDRDRTGIARTDADGRYACELPPGPYRVRLGHWGRRGPHGADCTVSEACTRNFVWLDEPVTAADAEELRVP